MNYIFIVIWSGWLLSEIFMTRLFHSKAKGREQKDKHMLILMWVTIVISILLGVICAIHLSCIISRSAVVNYSGLTLIIAGILIRVSAIRTLGKFFTVDLTVQSGQILVQRGLYKYVRHPAYTGSLLSFLGMGISLNNWISVVAIFIPVLASFIYRINVEEKMLLDQFGYVYRDYIQRTKRLLPVIY